VTKRPGGWSESERRYLVALSHDIRLGWVGLTKLHKHFGTWEGIWRANKRSLMAQGLTEQTAQATVEFTGSNDPKALNQALEDSDIKTLCMGEPDYPTLLSQIASPPATLFCRGSVERLEDEAIAVVGTRKISPYGSEAIEHLVPPLVAAGVTIVSGLALGTDARAHEVTVASGGRAVAVIGSGLNKLYPIRNERLASAILRQGAIISEFPPEMPALKHHFPIRNRIISGLSRGTLVIEAGQKSGSLITAKNALDENREVFAVPGDIFSQMSRGTNALIQQGAKPVMNASDIVEGLRYDEGNSRKIPLPDNPREATILSVLQRGPTHIETLINTCGMTVATLQQTLTLMELGDKVRHHGGGFYRIRR
jgi:DNA processing protein